MRPQTLLPMLFVPLVLGANDGPSASSVQARGVRPVPAARATRASKPAKRTAPLNWARRSHRPIFSVLTLGEKVMAAIQGLNCGRRDVAPVRIPPSGRGPARPAPARSAAPAGEPGLPELLAALDPSAPGPSAAPEPSLTRLGGDTPPSTRPATPESPRAAVRQPALDLGAVDLVGDQAGAGFASLVPAGTKIARADFVPATDSYHLESKDFERVVSLDLKSERAPGRLYVHPSSDPDWVHILTPQGRTTFPVPAHASATLYLDVPRVDKKLRILNEDWELLEALKVDFGPVPAAAEVQAAPPQAGQ